jgi:hypothetical protein
MSAKSASDVQFSEFLRYFFPSGAGVWVASFPDIADARWKGGWLSGWGIEGLPPENNNYFSIGVLNHDASGRDLGSLRQHVMLIADDVGTKANADEVRRLMGPPHARIRTSPGNETWVWKLANRVDAGGHEADLLGAVRDAMKARGLTDPGTIDGVRYIRAFPGRNNKAVYGPDGVPVELVEWSPELPGVSLVGPGGLAERLLGDDWEDRWHAGEFLSMAGVRDSVVSLTGGAGFSEPIVRLAAEIGLNPRRGAGAGKIDADCPNMAAHSQRPETGFAFLGGGLMKCHHGECAHLRTSDMVRLMQARYEAQVRAREALGILSQDEPKTGAGFLARETFRSVSLPAPTVLPPSRIAKRTPSSIAIGAIKLTVIFVLSPGIIISTPSPNITSPVTSVVRT